MRRCHTDVGREESTNRKGLCTLSVERQEAARPHAVQKLATRWAQPAQVTIRSDGRPSSVVGGRSSKSCKEGRIRSHFGHICAGRSRWTWIGRESSGTGGWHGRDPRMNLSSTARCRYHQNRRPLLGEYVHATTMLNLDKVGSDGTVPFEWWRGLGHQMADACSENECGIEWAP